MMFDTFLSVAAKVAYPVWFVTDGLRGALTRFARQRCYDLARQQSQRYWFNYLGHAMDHLEATAACERISFMTFAETSPTQVFGALTCAAGAVHFAKNKWCQYQLNQYKHKSESDIAALSDNQKRSFLIGFVSGQSVLSRVLAQGQYVTWRHGNAYFAGLAAGSNHDNGLQVKLNA